MNIKIPDISKKINKKDLLNALNSHYSALGPIWVTQQMDWMCGIYTSFKNHDKYLIVIYLLKKTLDFYSINFVLLSYDEFYKKDTVEIGNFTISEIAQELNIPKESARRKVNELEELGVIKKFKKKIIIDRSAFEYVKPTNTIKRISRFLAVFSKMLSEDEVLEETIKSSHLEIVIKNNFSFIWKIYYAMQIPMLLEYKKIFKDLESFHIFGTCVVNQHLYTHTKDSDKIIVDREKFLQTMVDEKMQGINSMSISDITGIPRATVTRKLKLLVKKKVLSIDNKKHYRLTGNFGKILKQVQNNNLITLSDFSTKIYNLALIEYKKKF